MNQQFPKVIYTYDPTSPTGLSPQFVLEPIICSTINDKYYDFVHPKIREITKSNSSTDNQ